MRVIGGVKTLLHDQGMTIRGVQKLFREQGIKHVSSHSPELYEDGELIEGKALDPAALARSLSPGTRCAHDTRCVARSDPG